MQTVPEADRPLELIRLGRPRLLTLQRLRQGSKRSLTILLDVVISPLNFGLRNRRRQGSQKQGGSAY